MNFMNVTIKFPLKSFFSCLSDLVLTSRLRTWERPYQVKSMVHLACYLLSQRYKSRGLRKSIKVEQIIFAPNIIPDFQQLMS